MKTQSTISYSGAEMPAQSSSSSEGSTGKEASGEAGPGEEMRSDEARCAGTLSSAPPLQQQHRPRAMCWGLAVWLARRSR